MASAPVPTVPRRRSFAGPLVLIVLGVVFLLGNMGVLTWGRIIVWFSHYWPVLLIFWGVVKLVEYLLAQRGGYAAPGLGAGGVFLVVGIVFFGLISSVLVRHGRNIPIVVNDQPFGLFGETYNFEEQSEQPFKPGSRLHVISGRGNITINTWDQDTVKVVASKHVVAETEDQAKQMNETAHVSVDSSANLVSIDASLSPKAVRIGFFNPPAIYADLQIYVPRKAAMEIETRRGDIHITGREGAITLTTSRGDIVLESITGDVQASMRGGQLRATDLTGNLNIDGHDLVDDLSISNVSGGIILNGDFASSTFRNIAKGVRFSSRRTDMETGRIAGELTMDIGDLRASQLTGFKIHTRSKDIHLEDISGNVEVANRNASVELHASKALVGNITINNDRGSIEIYLPANVGFQIEAQTRGGDIESDFAELNVQDSGRESKLSGSVGSKGGKVQLTTEHGDIEVRKAS